ncbi:U-box domain-containing protein 51-like [Pistacia vera]|uniref:U-box domain-containing protein 51-like n=1 Tax=Pistacia vera TaxID=55513 RepID=UPI001263A954|nr:U-box domain-containing protein 51-like [Pistacia vera]
MVNPQHLTYDESIPPNSTAVAIDKDKNSPHAVRWAIDHLIISNPLIILLHVKHKHENSNGTTDVDSDAEMQQLFTPFRGYCARKGVLLKEVVLEDNDIPKALLDYVCKNVLNNIVVGASTRNALASYESYRKFKSYDVSASLLKSAPDFCSVYVISKGKIISVRTAQRPAANTPAPPRQPSAGIPPQFPSDRDRGDGDDASRGQAMKGMFRVSGSSDRISWEKNNEQPRGASRDRQKSSPTNMSMESIEYAPRGSRSSMSRDSFSDNSEYSGPPAVGSMDMSAHNLDFSSVNLSPATSASSREIESEMRRLKLELKQTMELYSSACKEALNAKKKANELHQWQIEEAQKFEEARQAGEAALAVAEMEKAKCQAAIEAAEKAQRLAEMEAQRRRHAEMKAKREAEEKNRALNALAHNDTRYRRYNIEEIEQATSNFADSMKIGEGGYGPVYKGKLDHTAVAIKVLRPDAAQGKKQFQQEVEVLSCIRHPNMVLLLGACPDYGCLVYEYMHNGSLEDRLLRRGNSPPLSWRKRFKIAAEIATALLFLHQAKPEPLVHRDLKPANILLDRNYVSKISDVGLARLVPPSVADSVTQYHMTSAAGTFCYIDPEYQQTGMLTTRSDIYSLGIMLLQIITAKPPMGIAHHVGRAIEKGTFEEMLDPVVPDWPVEDALSFAKLAIGCAELRKKDRPDLGTVIVPELNRLRELGKRAGESLQLSVANHHGYSSVHGRNSAPRSPLTSSHPTISNTSHSTDST